MDYGSHKNAEGYSSTAKEFIQAQSEAAIARTLGTVKPPKTHAKTARPATSNYIGSDYEPPKMLWTSRGSSKAVDRSRMG